MEEIIDAVLYEIENSGYIDKLSAGVVITGGGAMLRHLPQLVKFKTGMDVRIGYPNEKLAADKNEEINQPMYATSIGLLLKGAEFLKEKNEKTGISTAAKEPVINKAEAVTTESAETVIIVEKEEKEKKVFGKTKIFDNMRELISDIFNDENDAKM
jgi:cell division protein FtsA